MLQRLDQEKATDVGIRGVGAKWVDRRRVAAGHGWRGPPTTATRSAGRRALHDEERRLPRAVDDTGHFLDGAAVFLAPAPAEPFGLAVVEAMAHGVPVVVAAGGGHLETAGDDALLFPPGDAGGRRATAGLGRGRGRAAAGRSDCVAGSRIASRYPGTSTSWRRSIAASPPVVEKRSADPAGDGRGRAGRRPPQPTSSASHPASPPVGAGSTAHARRAA